MLAALEWVLSGKRRRAIIFTPFKHTGDINKVKAFRLYAEKNPRVARRVRMSVVRSKLDLCLLLRDLLKSETAEGEEEEAREEEEGEETKEKGEREERVEEIGWGKPIDPWQLCSYHATRRKKFVKHLVRREAPVPGYICPYYVRFVQLLRADPKAFRLKPGEPFVPDDFSFVEGTVGTLSVVGKEGVEELECPACPYFVARELARQADVLVCSYLYTPRYIARNSPVGEVSGRDAVFFDECHLLSRHLLGLLETSLSVEEVEHATEEVYGTLALVPAAKEAAEKAARESGDGAGLRAVDFVLKHSEEALKILEELEKMVEGAKGRKPEKKYYGKPPRLVLDESSFPLGKEWAEKAKFLGKWAEMASIVRKLADKPRARSHVGHVANFVGWWLKTTHKVPWVRKEPSKAVGYLVYDPFVLLSHILKPAGKLAFYSGTLETGTFIACMRLKALEPLASPGPVVRTGYPSTFADWFFDIFVDTPAEFYAKNYASNPSDPNVGMFVEFAEALLDALGGRRCLFVATTRLWEAVSMAWPEAPEMCPLDMPVDMRARAWAQVPERYGAISPYSWHSHSADIYTVDAVVIPGVPVPRLDPVMDEVVRKLARDRGLEEMWVWLTMYMFPAIQRACQAAARARPYGPDGEPRRVVRIWFDRRWVVRRRKGREQKGWRTRVEKFFHTPQAVLPPDEAIAWALRFLETGELPENRE